MAGEGADEQEVSGGRVRRRRRERARQTVAPEQAARWLHESILANKRGIEDSAIYLSGHLAAMERGRAYEALGFASFEDYLGAPELRLTPTIVDRLRPLQTQLGEPLVPGGGRPAAPQSGLLTELLAPPSTRFGDCGAAPHDGAAAESSPAGPDLGMAAIETLATAAIGQETRLAVLLVVPSSPWRIEAILADGRTIFGEDVASILAQLDQPDDLRAEETSR